MLLVHDFNTVHTRPVGRKLPFILRRVQSGGLFFGVIVSDANREIPTQGQTDNAGNEVYWVSGIIR